MNTNLNQLKIFYFTAKHKSFTRAAEALCLTQPGVSKHIKDLEDQYEVKLFDRIGREIELTQAGEILFKSVEKIFNLVDQVKEEIDDLKELKTGELKVGSSVTIGIYLLPGILKKFKKLYPGSRIVLDINLNQQVIRQVLENAADIGLLGAPANDDRLVMAPFYSDELVIIASGNKWMKKENVNVEELINETFIIAGKGSGTRSIVENRLNEAGISLKNTIEFGNTEAIKKAVEAGLGISIISKLAIKREIQLGIVRSIPISGIDLKRKFYIVYRKDKYINAMAKSFLEFILYNSPHL